MKYEDGTLVMFSAKGLTEVKAQHTIDGDDRVYRAFNRGSQTCIFLSNGKRYAIQAKDRCIVMPSWPEDYLTLEQALKVIQQVMPTIVLFGLNYEGKPSTFTSVETMSDNGRGWDGGVHSYMCHMKVKWPKDVKECIFPKVVGLDVLKVDTCSYKWVMRQDGKVYIDGDSITQEDFKSIVEWFKTQKKLVA